ncbi:hypothetical protein [Aliikangiella sp. IMCC44359]|uniref:hypothetical protein n=1 Tax=Aliikangiella sp. IMCC44359 TaxID=3459125 RepID=UPI00403AA6E6
MFNKLFGKDKESVRILNNPEELQVGDMLEMVDSFGLPTQIRGKTFQVMSVNTYEYQSERETEFMIQGDDAGTFHMTIENEDGEMFVNFTLKIERDEVEALLDMDTFGMVFDEDICRESIDVIGNASSYERWVATSYRQQGEWYRGYYYKGDFRKKEVSSYESKDAEPFEAVALSSDDDMHFINVEVWEDGTTDVALGVSRPLSDIKALYGKV